MKQNYLFNVFYLRCLGIFVLRYFTFITEAILNLNLKQFETSFE